MITTDTIQCTDCGIEAVLPKKCSVCLKPFVYATTADGDITVSCPHSPEGKIMAKETPEPRPNSTRDVLPGFGPAVKARREAAGLTTQALGDLAETHQTTVSKIENEQRAPSLLLAVKLATALGVTVDVLVQDAARKRA